MIDLRAAYDHVDRDMLFSVLNIRTKAPIITSLLKALYTGTQTSINKRTVLGLSANFLNMVIRKKSEKQIFYPGKDFPSVKFFQLKTILNKNHICLHKNLIPYTHLFNFRLQNFVQVFHSILLL